jgi:hypothetical protein
MTMANSTAPENNQTRLTRIGNYDLPAAPLQLRSRGLPEAADLKKEANASVAENTIISFVAGTSMAVKDAVRHSCLLATLRANKAFPKDVQGENWYKLYLETMTDLGWVPITKAHQRHETHGSSLTMEKVALDIISGVLAAVAIPGAAGAQMLAAATKAVGALKSGNDEPLKLLQQRGDDMDGDRFAIASVAESADGEVIMALGTVCYSAAEGGTSLLFFKWESDSVKVYGGSAHLTLAPAVHEVAKAKMLEMLGDRVTNRIANYDID